MLPGMELLKGAVDNHIHVCPHLNARSITVFEAARQAEAAGMRAIGLMDNFCNSAGYAALAMRELADPEDRGLRRPDHGAAGRRHRARGCAGDARLGLRAWRRRAAEFAGEVLAATTPAAMERELIVAVDRGIDGTGVRAGIIGEINCSWPLHALERKALVAAARAQAATGAAITIHTGRDPAAPHENLDVLRTNGARPERVIIGHLDRTLIEIDDVLRLAGRGCGLEWDFFGIESSYYPFAPIDLPNDGRRLELIRAVMDRGHQAQVLIAHDICTKTRLRRLGGHGYAHILENVVPVMRRRGFTAAEVDLLLSDNPRRILTLS